MKHVYLPTFTLLLLYHPVIAQNNKEKAPQRGYHHAIRTEMSPLSLNFKAGLTQFFGELNEQDMKGSLGIGLNGRISNNFSLGLEYTAGKIGGQKTQLFNSYFINEYNTIEFLAKWNLTNQFNKHKSSDVDVNIYGGAGLMIFDVNAYSLSSDQLVRFSNSKLSKRNQLFLRWGNPRGKSGIKKTNERVIPIGMSIDYNLLERWKIGLDYRFYFIRTDKADATSGRRLTNPEEQDSYSDTPNDKFSLLSVTLTHCFVKHRKH